MKQRIPASVTAVLITVALLASCGPTQHNAPLQTSTSTIKSQEPPHAVSQPPGISLPDGITWLSTLDNPATLHWDDAPSVARAYIKALYTWDSKVDASDQASWVRASIYATPDLQPSLRHYNPGNSHPSATYTNSWKHQSYTAVIILDHTREGIAHGNADSVTITWRQDTYMRDGFKTISTSGSTYVALAKHQNTWQVSSFSPALESPDLS
ncbi:hypothetical protein [Bifidobacterium xylocopae]|uniref:hypothetical protein n=1 Tax=Bifidobacterium xylocopae TaxID=2493119 RepID=UPI000FDDF9C5|nr:hypothetical protein [Bifidobacterium xylocopae]